MIARQRADGTIELEQGAEPPMEEEPYTAERWRLFVRGDLVAEWDSIL